MADDCGVDEIVSQFFLDTCLPRHRVHSLEIRALLEGAHKMNFTKTTVPPIIRSLMPIGDCFVTPLITGSVAEFYIDPVLPCIGDIDIMYHHSDELAIPEDYSPPTQLPTDEFGKSVAVVEIIGSEFPGYVYLMRSCYLIKYTADGRYYDIPLLRDYRDLLPHISARNDNRKGPANVTYYDVELFESAKRYRAPSDVKQNHSRDTVQCIRCLLWPSQAADWPTRQRNSGWPDSATVDRVVSNGCDVVQASHRLCRDDEWESSHQHRLSFSRAEIVLLNSWMRVHQIMYHMLQIFVKAHIESNESEAKTLSNYHIKTLMLWACELKPASWWSDDFNVVEICVKLLHVLGVWLRDARCKHYFVRKCNLFDHLDKSGSHQLTAVKLTSVTVQSLSKWFVDNYIRKCSEYACTYFLGADSLSLQSPLFENTSTNAKLQDAVTEFVSRKHKHVTRSFAELFANFTPCQYYICLLYTSDAADE